MQLISNEGNGIICLDACGPCSAYGPWHVVADGQCVLPSKESCKLLDAPGEWVFEKGTCMPDCKEPYNDFCKQDMIMESNPNIHSEIPDHIDGMVIGGIVIDGVVVGEEISIPVKMDKSIDPGCTELALLHVIKNTRFLLEPPFDGFYRVSVMEFAEGLTQDEFDECIQFILEKTNQKSEYEEDKEPEK